MFGALFVLAQRHALASAFAAFAFGVVSESRDAVLAASIFMLALIVIVPSSWYRETAARTLAAL
ncbi:MAG TPA: hypothetical protein VEJ20_03160, partial [Candidatus Eremiobacteraceae bacterium]|nr:hypothetical protein [Candidatus Eremiobacteraceae bacterium]